MLNDGLIGRSKKTPQAHRDVRPGRVGVAGRTLKGAVTTKSGEDASSKRMSEVIAGRSVLSMPGKPGGLRLRYGRACNTGFAGVGMHPALAEILGSTVVAGTQIKMDVPGKGATVAFVDSIDTPHGIAEGWWGGAGARRSTRRPASRQHTPHPPHGGTS